MGFLLKLALFVLLVIAIWGYLMLHGSELKQATVEFINPTAKEKRLLGELNENLDILEKYVDKEAPGEDKTPEGLVKGVTSYEIIDESRNLIDEIKEINKGKTSTISSGVGRITDLIRKPIEALKGNGSVDTFKYETEDGRQYMCNLIEE